MGKVERRIEVDAELAAKADAHGVALSEALEEGIRAVLRRTSRSRVPTIAEAAEIARGRSPQEMETAARQWAAENAEAIAAHERFIEEYGVFGEDLRTW